MPGRISPQERGLISFGLILLLAGVAATYLGRQLRVCSAVAGLGALVVWVEAIRWDRGQLAILPVHLHSSSRALLLILVPVAAAAVALAAGAGLAARARGLAASAALAAVILLTSETALVGLCLLGAALIPDVLANPGTSGNGWKSLGRRQAMLMAAVALTLVAGPHGLPAGGAVAVVFVLGLLAAVGAPPFAGEPGPVSATAEDVQLEWAARLTLLGPATGIALLSTVSLSDRSLSRALVAAGLLALGAGAVWPAFEARIAAAWSAGWWTDVGLGLVACGVAGSAGLHAMALLLGIQILPRLLVAFRGGRSTHRLGVLLAAGLPLTAAFAARLWILQLLSHSPAILVPVLLGTAISTAWQVHHALRGAWTQDQLLRRPRYLRLVGVVGAILLVGLGLAPAGLGALFGVAG